MGVWGTQRIFSVGDPAPPVDWTRGRRVDLAFGAPLYVGPGDDLTERTHELGHALTGLLEGLQRLPHHRPRPGEVATWYPAHLGGHAPTPTRGGRCSTRCRSTRCCRRGDPTPEVFDDVSRRAPDANGLNVLIGSTSTLSRLETGCQASSSASPIAASVVSAKASAAWAAAQSL